MRAARAPHPSSRSQLANAVVAETESRHRQALVTRSLANDARAHIAGTRARNRALNLRLGSALLRGSTDLFVANPAARTRAPRVHTTAAAAPSRAASHARTLTHTRRAWLSIGRARSSVAEPHASGFGDTIHLIRVDRTGVTLDQWLVGARAVSRARDNEQ